MKRLGLAKLVRYRTNTDTVTFPDEEMLIYANLYLREIAELINDVDEDYFGTTSYRNLVADQREYSLPSDILNSLTSVEVKFSSDGDYVPLFEVDIDKLPQGSSLEAIRPYFNNNLGYAGYDIYGNLLILYCGEIIDLAAGVKLNYFAEPDELPDLTDDTTDMSIDPGSTGHGFPKSFHELLARRICIEWKSNKQQPIPLTDLEQKYEFDLQRKLSSLTPRNKSRAVIPRIPLIDGYDSEANLPFALRSGSGNIYDGSDL